MQDLQLSEIFGIDASQDLDNLTIKKSNLLGLIPSSSNHAEEIFVSILLTALNQFQGDIADENGELITDEVGESIGYNDSEFYYLRANYWRKQVITRKSQKYVQFQLLIHDYQIL